MTRTRVLLAFPGAGPRSLDATPLARLLPLLEGAVVFQTICLPVDRSDAALVQTMGDTLAASASPEHTVIGGFSLGARIAAMLSLQVHAPGLIGLSFPFHRHRHPEQQHGLEVLRQVTTPTLIVQGTRDAHGNRQQVRGMGPLPAHVGVSWLEGATHQWAVRATSDASSEAPEQVAAHALRSFLEGLVSRAHV